LECGPRSERRLRPGTATYGPSCTGPDGGSPMARRPGTALPSMFVGNKPAVARPTLAAAVLALSDICRNWRKMRCELAVNSLVYVCGFVEVDVVVFENLRTSTVVTRVPSSGVTEIARSRRTWTVICVDNHLIIYSYYARLYAQLGTSNWSPEANTPQASGECVVQMIVLRT